MSLQLHLSSLNDELLATLRPRLAAARQTTLAAGAGIPRPIPVLLPSSQLGDWLQVQLARELGLSMGFEFLQPSAFFKRHFAAGGVGADFARAHAFWAPERLRWQLLPEVDQIALHLGLDSATTLAPRDRFAFAQLLAQQFDRYARYRPDWPARWDADQPARKFDSEELPAAALTDEAWQRQHEICEDAELLAAAAGVSLEVKLEPGIRIQGDELHLRRLVLNLLDNACKYNRPAGCVRCVLGLDAGDAVLRVANTGPGIPPELHERIFERFFRADTSRPNTRGHGLGLALCWEIVEVHGGRLTLLATSEPGWTEFEIRLPSGRELRT